MDDDAVVVDTAPEPDTQRRGLSGLWLVIVGAAAVVLVLGVTQGGQAPPVTTIAPLPSITVPPTIPRGQIVDQTLLWANPVGLDDVVRPSDVVRFDDRYWLVGSAAEGIGTWTSIDGVTWNQEGWVIPEGDFIVSDVHAGESGLALVATGWAGDEWITGVFHSSDGRNWQLSESDDSTEPMPTWGTLTELDGGFLLSGWTEAPRPVGYLPEPYRTLAKRGSFWVTEEGGKLTVWVAPGLEVAEIPSSELTGPRPPPVNSRFRTWRGPIDDLRPEPSGAPVEQITRLEDGTFVGVSPFATELMVSADAAEWETLEGFGGASSLASWRHGVVALSWTEAPAFWSPGSSGTDRFFPDEFTSRDLTYVDAGAEVGLVVSYFQPSAPPVGRPDPIGPIHGEDAEYQFTGVFGDIQLLENGDTIWRQSDPASSVALLDETLVFESSRGETFEISLDSWLEVVVPAWMGADTSESGVLHTVDGSRWSEREWSTILGDGKVFGPMMVATDDFVLVGDYPPLGEAPIAPIKVGFPLD